MTTTTTTRNPTQLAYTLNSRGMPVPQMELQSSGPSSSHSSQPRHPSLSTQRTQEPTGPPASAIASDPASFSAEEVPNQDIESVIPPREPANDARPHHIKNESVVSYVLPSDPTRRVVERYNLEDTPAQIVQSPEELPVEEFTNRPLSEPPYTLDPRPMSITTLPPAMPRHPAFPNNGAVPPSPTNGGFYPRISPTAASPSQRQASMLVPISTNSRAMAQQPTYINPPHSPVPLNPEYSQPQPRVVEEVCLECAMRDEDMAGVDVTSPGAWERESDADFYELLRREREEQETGSISTDWHNRPKSVGDRLLEASVKRWLKMNPTEPDSRHQTLTNYLKTQRSLLEEEAISHARAMRESQQLEMRARDAYSRRSINEVGPNGAPAMEEHVTRHVASASGGRSHSRDVTLLDNGLLVESLDVRKEEKEERERRRREDKARKSSRTSVYSVTLTDSGVGGLKPHSRFSVASSGQGNSFSRDRDRPPLPRAHSQASFSDAQSMDRGSPKHRFFGFKNLSTGFRSRDSLAASVMSGSMVDMHLGLQRESLFVQSPDDTATHVFPLRMNGRVSEEAEVLPTENVAPETTKKKGGLAKIWRLVTGAKAADSKYTRGEAFSRTEDNLPLTPPPPLSYLVERSPANAHHRVLSSTSSLPSTMNSPKFSIMANGGHQSIMSPAMSLAPLSPSPASPARRSRNISGSHESRDVATELRIPSEGRASMADVQQRSVTMPVVRPISVYAGSRDKSLPALPPDSGLVEDEQSKPFQISTNGLPPGAGPPMPGLYLSSPDAPYQNGASQRPQSFNGVASSNFVPQMVTSQSFNPSMSRPEGQDYNDFALNARAADQYDAQSLQPYEEPQSSKRKSKFAFPSLFSGRKSTVGEPFARSIRSETIRDDASSFGYTSRSSVAPRLSIMSRRALEESIEQDPQFVAYRYPSNQPCDPVQ